MAVSAANHPTAKTQLPLSSLLDRLRSVVLEPLVAFWAEAKE
jgi:hypothetical protein